MLRTSPIVPAVLLLLPACSDWYVTVTRKDYSDILALESALSEYAAGNQGRYPEALEALTVPDETGYSFLHREAIPLDPWGNAYAYERSGEAGIPPRIVCYGSDGAPGGKGDAQDIDNFIVRKRIGWD